MKCYGRSKISEFLGDFIIYRNLAPVDQRLPSLTNLRQHLNMNVDLALPRKNDHEYAKIVVELLKRARSIDQVQSKLERLIYLGDTRMSDGTAFVNVCRAGGWQGLCFIGSERPDQPSKMDIEVDGNETFFLSNRWTTLNDFDQILEKRGFTVDEKTVVIVDLDKTALGARGRNDRVIDRARVEAAHCIADDLLGKNFDRDQFQIIYESLNKPEFHPFTADNQDYLVYICLVIGSGMFDLNHVVQHFRSGEIASFDQFIEQVEIRADQLPDGLNQTHENFYKCWKSGDPTPFKSFRYCEYQNTSNSMGCFDDSVELETMLKEEIVITQEVRQASLRWRSKGALLFGLSDKPDEASFPTPELSQKGYKVIHQIETHIVGE